MSCVAAHIEGMSLAESDAWWLVDTLRASGRADDVIAAYAIHLGIISGRDIGLPPNQREAVSRALANPPQGLVPLCSRLFRRVP